MTVLRRISEARGGVSAIAKAANLNVKMLYRTLSSKGNPSLYEQPLITSATWLTGKDV